MNKSAIQKYAIWARNELIEQIKQRAFQYGINETGFGDENASVVAGRVLTNDEKRQRKQFIEIIKRSTYQQVIEEVAYTWFNRFIALRYMEVNDYLPTHVRVFSDTGGNFKPEVLSNVLHIDLPGLDKDKVSEFLNNNQTQELYRYLLLTQCNALNELLPEMFERLGAYTEMLLPNNILKPEGVIGRLVNDIPEEDFKDAVQIIGWMYQYYNTEPKQEVFDGLKKNIKITKEKIPAATQLFTPDWIVRYMVENSLGRLWIDSHPNSKLREGWKYYVDEADQAPEVANRLSTLRTKNAIKSPEDIKFIDPCMGSGHILVYAFDVLVQIYTSEGYSERDAAQLILEKNLFGLDIDRRAYQLSYFALMMKARQYNRRILSSGVHPQVYEPTGYPEGMEFGSLIKVDQLEVKPEVPQNLSLFDESYEVKLNKWNFRRLLAQKYDVVVTNPPYMGASGMDSKMLDFVKKYYFDGKNDLYSAFIVRCGDFLCQGGYQSMITMESWMFLSSFEKLRENFVFHNTLVNLLHMPYLGKGGTSLGINFGTAAFIFRKNNDIDYKTQFIYIRYFETNDDGVPFNFPVINHRYCTNNISNFLRIEGKPIVYSANNKLLHIMQNNSHLYDLVDITGSQHKTADNEKYLRFFWEVEKPKIGKLWVTYSKGGAFRKWWGNIELVVDWSAKAQHFYRSNVTSNFIKSEYQFREGLTWTATTNNAFSLRVLPASGIFDVKGPSMFPYSIEDTLFVLGLMNSNSVLYILKMFKEGSDYQNIEIKRVPLPSFDEEIKENISKKVKDNVEDSRIDWNYFETSLEFTHHPLFRNEHTIKVAFLNWSHESTERFYRVKSNEEEINRIFIDLYSLQDELSPKLEDKDITLRLPDEKREIKSLISYAVGCMFGRYSLDTEGLVYAGGEWDVNKYQKFSVDKDNIIPILDDEYFEDDIVGRFVTFIKTVYGEDTLEENLKFIADALGGKGTSREIIRDYFIYDFYTDHLKIYQKRPIYWLFDSGKKNGFKALIYIHRYSRDLLAKLRTDYVHEQQERYRTQLSRISSELNHALGTERSKLLKQQDKLTEQLKEITLLEEKVHHLADQHIEIDLDDGVKKNYALFEDVLAKI